MGFYKMLCDKNCIREDNGDVLVEKMEKKLLKNERLRELKISVFCVSCDKYERFREALRTRKKRLVYSNHNHEVTLKQYIELDKEFGGRIDFSEMDFVKDESIDKKYLSLLN